MKFTKILTIAFTLAFAYAQYDDAAVQSDIEINQIDTAGVEPQNYADATNYGGENSDDYGDEAGVNALDGMDEDSNDENAVSNPSSSSGTLTQVVSSPENNTPEITIPETTTPESTVPESTVPESTVPESTVPEATSPEADATAQDVAAQNDAIPNILDTKDEIPEDEIPLIKPLFNGASGEAAPIAAKEAKETPIAALDDSSKTETSIDPAKIASGLVGAAALSSAGIFFMVKRAKRRGLESVRSQISMA